MKIEKLRPGMIVWSAPRTENVGILTRRPIRISSPLLVTGVDLKRRRVEALDPWSAEPRSYDFRGWRHGWRRWSYTRPARTWFDSPWQPPSPALAAFFAAVAQLCGVSA